MIFYFSGTGNSEWAAKEIARLTLDEARDLAPILREGGEVRIPEGERFGIVFPIYAWAAPKPVRQFLARVRTEGCYRFAVCTCGDEAGRAMKKLSASFPLQAAWSLAMPNNYIPMFDIDPAEVARKKGQAARMRLHDIAGAVCAGRSVFDVEEGSMPAIKSGLIAPMFNRFAMSDKPFFAEDTCTSCGLCERLCPTQNIVLQDGKPTWQGSCVQCLACLHRCPASAIQYGKSTKNKGRYYFGKDE